MKTSNFANNQRHNLNGISISRYPATRQGFTGPEFPPLFPSAQLLSWYKSTPQSEPAWVEYCESYDAQLGCLNAAAVYEELTVIAEAFDAEEVVLLCYESAKTLDTQPCHRRLVASWFERELGIVVPEWSKPHTTAPAMGAFCCLPFRQNHRHLEQPLQPPHLDPR